ncbi:hypothetical protein NHX12_010563, partial [Muraenolepis orangiensis]
SVELCVSPVVLHSQRGAVCVPCGPPQPAWRCVCPLWSSTASVELCVSPVVLHSQPSVELCVSPVVLHSQRGAVCVPCGPPQDVIIKPSSPQNLAAHRAWDHPSVTRRASGTFIIHQLCLLITSLLIDDASLPT